MAAIKPFVGVVFFGAVLYCLVTLSAISAPTSGAADTASVDEIPAFGLGTWLSEKGKAS